MTSALVTCSCRSFPDKIRAVERGEEEARNCHGA
ncbi:hypothetical protein ACP4OV_003321 [Aristida adscensionis]